MMNSKQLCTRQVYATQAGATLMVALMFLLIMTLFAVSSINMSTTNLKIIGNMQATKTLDGNARDIIEQLMGTADTFDATPTNSVVITEYDPATSAIVTTNVVLGTNNTPGTAVTTALGTIVYIEDPECVDTQVAPGYSELYPDSLQNDNVWEIVVHFTDPVTGATSEMHQGTQVRMLAGNCPD